MKHTEKIINKFNSIDSTGIAAKYGFSELKIHASTTDFEENSLNIIATKQDDVLSPSHVYLKLALERELGCNVNICSKEKVDSFIFKLKEEQVIDIKKESIEVIKQKLGEFLQDAANDQMTSDTLTCLNNYDQKIMDKEYVKFLNVNQPSGSSWSVPVPFFQSPKSSPKQADHSSVTHIISQINQLDEKDLSTVQHYISKISDKKQNNYGK